DPRRWLAGDLHVHVTPPDTEAEGDGTLDDIVASAKQQDLDFVALTPHLREATWPSRKRAWAELATRARALDSPRLLPGAEWTTPRGHFTVLGADITKFPRDGFLGAARADGAFISVNHPFAVPTHVAHLAVSDFDMSYRVWSAHEPGFSTIDGAEVW